MPGVRRKALLWGVLLGALVAASVIVTCLILIGWRSLQADFWIGTAIVFALVVVVFTGLTSRLWRD